MNVQASGSKQTIPAAKETTPVKPTPTRTLEMPKTSKSPKGSKFVNGSGKKSPQVVESSDVSKTPKSSKKSPKAVESSDISKIPKSSKKSFKVIESSDISNTPKSFKEFPKVVESPNISQTQKNALVFKGGDKKSPKVSETAVVHTPQSKLKAHSAMKSKGSLSKRPKSVQ